jgi:hypothetical protein
MQKLLKALSTAANKDEIRQSLTLKHRLQGIKMGILTESVYPPRINARSSRVAILRWLPTPLLLGLYLCSLSSLCWSFGPTGHRVTGAIAENYLSEKSKLEIRALLGNESLAEASTYVDEMRSHPSTFWQKTANAYHYVTVPKGKSYREAGAPSKGDAVTALKHYTEILKNPNNSLEQRRLALKFVIHLIADLHQPLHVGNGTDRGGNDVKLKFFWQPTNLHRVWDSELIDRQQLSFTEWSQWLNRTISQKDLTDWRSNNPLDWIAESIAIRNRIYPKDKTIDWDYQYQHLPTLKLRLKQAGVRIAHYLNTLFE